MIYCNVSVVFMFWYEMLYLRMLGLSFEIEFYNDFYYMVFCVVFLYFFVYQIIFGL